MKLCIRLVLCTSMLVACEQTTDPSSLPEFPIGIQPGTRLSPKMLLADDGTIFPHSTIWKDSEFGECEFRTAADGKYRCLPNALLQTTPGYLDSACLQEVFVYNTDLYCMPMSAYILVQSAPSACGTPDTVRVFKADLKADALTVYRKLGSQCAPWLTFPSPEDVDVYVLANNEVDPSEFVSAWR